MPRVPFLAVLGAATVIGAHSAGAQGQPAPAAPAAPPVRVAASSFASVEVHLNARRIGNQWYEEDASLSGPSRIAITYGQPHARGRRVEGGLIPLDTVWRFGANMATTLHADVDLTLGDLKLPRRLHAVHPLHAIGVAADREPRHRAMGDRLRRDAGRGPRAAREPRAAGA